jgi:hypothetical protein
MLVPYTYINTSGYRYHEIMKGKKNFRPKRDIGQLGWYVGKTAGARGTAYMINRISMLNLKPRSVGP